MTRSRSVVLDEAPLPQPASPVDVAPSIASSVFAVRFEGGRFHPTPTVLAATWETVLATSRLDVRPDAGCTLQAFVRYMRANLWACGYDPVPADVIQPLWSALLSIGQDRPESARARAVLEMLEFNLRSSHNARTFANRGIGVGPDRRAVPEMQGAIRADAAAIQLVQWLGHANASSGEIRRVMEGRPDAAIAAGIAIDARMVGQALRSCRELMDQIPGSPAAWRWLARNATYLSSDSHPEPPAHAATEGSNRSQEAPQRTPLFYETSLQLPRQVAVWYVSARESAMARRPALQALTAMFLRSLLDAVIADSPQDLPPASPRSHYRELLDTVAAVLPALAEDAARFQTEPAPTSMASRTTGLGSLGLDFRLEQARLMAESGPRPGAAPPDDADADDEYEYDQAEPGDYSVDSDGYSVDPGRRPTNTPDF